MGAGYHGGFGKTKGKLKHQKNLESNNKKEKTSSTFSSIENNANAMSHKYPMTNGYFGIKGMNHRIIYSKNQYETASDFYLKITYGGIEKNLPNDKGKINYLSDGTKIVYRTKTSTPQSPAIEITVYYPNNVRGQKIHFLKEK